MYRAFELKLDDGLLMDDRFSRFTSHGKNKLSDSEVEIENMLREVYANGTIDGTALSNQYFPTLRRDVFLSYSHNDQDLAYMVSGILDSCFGLNVFIDSMFWGSADKLLKEIDDAYCRNKSGPTYSYDKRNFSTAHVHTMLTSAIMKAMDQAEIIIFINTPNSAPNLSNAINKNRYDEYTLSPWIYEEIMLTKMLRITDWQVYRRCCRNDEAVLEHFAKSLNVRYKLQKEKLIPLSLDDIVNWHEEYEKRKNANFDPYDGLFLKKWKHGKHPLNVLYDIKCGEENEG